MKEICIRLSLVIAHLALFNMAEVAGAPPIAVTGLQPLYYSDPPVIITQVRVFEISEEKLRAIETLFGTKTKTIVEVTPTVTAQNPVAENKSNPIEDAETSIVLVDDNGLFEKLFDRLERNGALEVISRPQIRSLSGQMATIEIGKRFPQQEGDEWPQPRKLSFRLSSLATELPGGVIQVELQSDRKPATGDSEPDFQIDSTVELARGQTVVFSGPVSERNGEKTVILTALTARFADKPTPDPQEFTPAPTP